MKQLLGKGNYALADDGDMITNSEWKSSRTIGIAVALLFFLKFAIFAIYITPLWDSPDEPGHYSYIVDLSHGHYPVLGEALIDPEVANSWLGANKSPRKNWIAQHPPLSYALAAPVEFASRTLGLGFDARVRAARLTSSFIGALAMLGLAAFLTISTRSLALGMAGAIFVAATPMFTQVSGAVTNDTLVACTAAWAAYWYARWIGSNAFKHALVCAAIIGLGCVTKITMLVLAIPMFFTMAYRITQMDGLSRPIMLLKKLGLLWATMFALISLWIIHNYLHFAALLPTARILRNITHDATHIGFLHFMKEFPIWQTILWNFIALVGWMGTIPGKVMTGAADGLIAQFYTTIILFGSTAAILYPIRKIGKRDIEWPCLAVAAIFTVSLCATMAKVPYTTVTCAALFLAVVCCGAANIASLRSTRGTSWLIFSASAFVLFFTAIYYYKIWGFYNQISHVKGLHGRYFYVVMPFISLLVLYPLRRRWLPMAALYASCIALVIADGFFLHYAFEMYGKY